MGSKKYARAIDGDDLQISTIALGEIVLYTSVSSDSTSTSQPISTPTYNSNGSGGVSIGSGAGSPIGVTNSEQTLENETRFTDTIGHWAQADIEEMAEKGIVTGVTASTFEPVSYTHLDVYKRQYQYHAPKSGGIPCLCSH